MGLCLHIHSVYRSGVNFHVVTSISSDSTSCVPCMSSHFLTISFLHGLMRWRDRFKLNRTNVTGNTHNISMDSTLC